MDYYTVYKITNLIDGKIYIGTHKTKRLEDGYMGSGTYLLNAIEKHGVENFKKEILFVFETSEEMYLKEAELVNEEFIKNPETYNIKIGGSGGFDYINTSGKYLYGFPNLFKGWSKTPEQNRKISESLKKRYEKGFDNPFKGKRHSEETKRLISEKVKLALLKRKQDTPL